MELNKSPLNWADKAQRLPMQNQLSIDPDIRCAATLPAEFYRSTNLFEEVREKVFARSWQWVGHAGELPTKGSVRPFLLVPGCLDEPLLLTRSLSGRLSCLSNVCTHRGNLVQTEKGECKKLRCRYHGRRFALDGKFEGMPEFECAKNFPSAADDLPQLPLHSWHGLLFTGLEPAVAFHKWIRPLQEMLRHLPLEDFHYDSTRSREYLVHANWALYVDNFLEGFHVPFVHQGLSQSLDFQSYSIEIFPWSSMQWGKGRGPAPVFQPRLSGPASGEKVAAYYFWLFPNTMLNFYPWGLSINVVQPLSVNETRVCFHSFVWRPELLDQGAGGALDQVEREDEAVVEQVQTGIGSRLYKRGRYSPKQERAVHHFHRLLLRALGNEQSSTE